MVSKFRANSWAAQLQLKKKNVEKKQDFRRCNHSRTSSCSMAPFARGFRSSLAPRHRLRVLARSAFVVSTLAFLMYYGSSLGTSSTEACRDSFVMTKRDRPTSRAGSIDDLLNDWADGHPAATLSVPPPPVATKAPSAGAYIAAFVEAERGARRRARGLRRLAQAAALSRGGGGGTSSNTITNSVDAGGEHEDDIWLPEPSHLDTCISQVDGSELCVYTNVCVDALTSGASVGEDNFHLLFIDSTVIPPTEELAKIKLQHQDTRRTGPPRTGEARDAADAARRARHAAQLTVGRGQHDLREKLKGHDDFMAHDDGWDSVFEDIRPDTEKEYLAGNRRVPFSFGTRTRIISPAATMPMHLGGEFNGTVAWVDNMYVGRLLQGGHMWGCSASLLFPLFGAWFANASQHLQLPPLDHVVLLHKDHSRIGNESDPNPLGSYSGRWCLDGTLQVAGYAVGSPAWVGRTAAAPSLNGAFPHLEELARIEASSGGGVRSGGKVDATLRVPYSFLTLKNSVPGARFVFTSGDVPSYPDPFGAPLRPAPPPANTWDAPHTPPRNYRVCGKRVVALGNRALLLGGQAEGSA